MVVKFIFFKSFFTEACISSFKLWSMFENGSSNNNKSGFDTRDLAKETL